MRRDQVPRGAAYNHPNTSRMLGPQYLALGQEDLGFLGETVDPRKRWSVPLLGVSVMPLWCYVESDCRIYPPDTWDSRVWEHVHLKVRQLASIGVCVTPMCRRLYQAEGGVG